MAQEDGDFSHSFTDLMTSLAIAFLILAVAAIVNNALSSVDQLRKIDELEGADLKVTEFKEDLQNKIALLFNLTVKDKNKISENDCVQIDPVSKYKLIIRFKGNIEACKKSGLFFDRNAADLGHGDSPAIQKIANLYAHFCDGELTKPFIDQIQIVGHTDSEQKNAGNTNCDRYNENSLQCGNLELSANRARSIFLRVGKILHKDLQERKSNLFNCYKAITQITGRGPFDPLLDGSVDEEGSVLVGNLKSTLVNPLDRRVEVMIDLLVPRLDSVSKDAKDGG